MSEEEIIRGCAKYESASQRTLYEIYFPRMMQVCIRYAKNQQEAKEILLDGFKNIFNHFLLYLEENSKKKSDSIFLPLEEWVKKQIVESAIRHMHANKREYFVSSTVSSRDSEKTSSEITDDQIIKAADKKNIIKALQQLSPSYRAVYNLHEVDGYSHQEISKLLDISEYTSKDSLSKAKFNLRKNLVRIVPANIK